jgi:hypothetical protein
VLAARGLIGAERFGKLNALKEDFNKRPPGRPERPIETAHHEDALLKLALFNGPSSLHTAPKAS